MWVLPSLYSPRASGEQDWSTASGPGNLPPCDWVKKVRDYAKEEENEKEEVGVKEEKVEVRKEEQEEGRGREPAWSPREESGCRG